MKLVNIAALMLSVALPVSVGYLGSLAGDRGNSDWYKQLKKPPWTPPNWAFPVVWTTLYVLMGVAAWWVWIQGDLSDEHTEFMEGYGVFDGAGFEKQGIALGVYLFQLLLNFLWTPLFFGFHSPGLAFAEIVLLWLAIAVTIYLFWKVDPIASYLLVPYIFWVTVASTINLYIFIYYSNSKRDTEYDIVNTPEQHSKSS